MRDAELNFSLLTTRIRKYEINWVQCQQITRATPGLLWLELDPHLLQRLRPYWWCPTPSPMSALQFVLFLLQSLGFKIIYQTISNTLFTSNVGLELKTSSSQRQSEWIDVYTFSFLQNVARTSWRHRMQGIRRRPCKGCHRERFREGIQLLWTFEKCLGGPQSTWLCLYRVWRSTWCGWRSERTGWHVWVDFIFSLF